MKVLLVDDEELQLIRLKETCAKVLPDSVFITYTNPVKAFEGTIKEQIDLAFLDIEMPVMNGLTLARKLKLRSPSTKVIFVTAHDQYARDAFRVHASGFISKPVNEAKVQEEIGELSRPIVLKATKRIQAKCFGHFEILCDGQPIKFKRSKSKELIAYLIDRNGAAINMAELNAVLWEEDHPSYLRNLISDIQQAFKEIGCEDIFVKRHNECFIDASKIDCDAYEFQNNNPDAIRLFRGEYMTQYPWAMFADY